MRRFTSSIFLAVLLGCGRPAAPRVVLYCAQDQEFAEAVLADFTKQSGMPVTPKYDTEAAKSVGLVAELQLEVKRPRCDVHWNNEIVGTIRLQRQGVYESYRSAAGAPYPEWTRSADGTWHAFAARARVLVVHADKVPEAERPKGMLDLVDPKWKGKVAMAKPQFGTTATQAACLWEALGADAARRYYEALKANGVQIVAGNKQAAEAVGSGAALVGVTDTDDALGEVEAGKPVVIVFPDRAGHPDHPRLGTLFIPNTLAVVKGCPNPEGARELVDYLLSEAVERGLAEGPSHQLPLNPEVKAKLPKALDGAAGAKPMEVDWAKAADRWDEVQGVMRELFAR